MPNINVYIRSGDLEKFQALKNKSEFIHNALNGEPKTIMFEGKMLAKKELPAKKESQIFSRVKGGQKRCKHGAIKGECWSKEAYRLKCNVV